MFTSYGQAVDWIHSRLRLGIKPGLRRMEWMLERLEHPERKLKTIHIGGTNGKGSTVTFLSSILQAAGYHVGTFTSPYFEHFNERISINGKAASDEEIVQLVNVIKPLADELESTELGGPTEFEVITAMSMYYFAHIQPSDVVIYEVGLGGRFDSTNVIHPLLSIITSIGMDHTSILGDTIEEIAFEKAGIIKNGVSIISGVRQPEALTVIKERAAAIKAPLYQLGKDFTVDSALPLQKGTRFDFQSLFGSYGKLELRMMGEHQAANASLAVMAAQILSSYYSILIEEQDIRDGLNNAYWPGRFEVLSESPLVVIDGAHNEEGIEALAKEVESRYRDKHKEILFGALKDKKLDGMIAKLDSLSDDIVFTSFDFPRAAGAEELFDISQSLNKRVEEDWKSFLEQAITNRNQKDLLLITGSLYFLSEAKPFIKELLDKK
ncbi:folylpolyglutamate synthase/dihydrofolate synthase family protein [Mesobacillus foraminis]|uniref:bifunctional folylpolyglutamate synthase/dihydrofolate synthase n=1 Tax=Mesobacillus foraminis TaxID=279826 RepID=UPI0039A3E77A